MPHIGKCTRPVYVPSDLSKKSVESFLKSNKIDCKIELSTVPYRVLVEYIRSSVSTA